MTKSPVDARDDQHALQLATAALLVEMMHADYEVDPQERKAIERVLHAHFTLSEDEAAELIQLAEQQRKQAASLFEYTSLIDKGFSREQKVEVVEMLWRVAFADGEKDKYEESLVRKIAELLHLSHIDFIKARHKVEEEIEKQMSAGGNSPAV